MQLLVVMELAVWLLVALLVKVALVLVAHRLIKLVTYKTLVKKRILIVTMQTQLIHG